MAKKAESSKKKLTKKEQQAMDRHSRGLPLGPAEKASVNRAREKLDLPPIEWEDTEPKSRSRVKNATRRSVPDPTKTKGPKFRFLTNEEMRERGLM